MVTRTFLKAHADAVDALREMLKDDPFCPPELGRLITVACDEAAPEDVEQGQEESLADESDGPVVEYFHVASRIHLSRYLLKKDIVKEILAEQCIHYARVCEIEIIHYCIMDNHFHLFLGIRRESLAISKMMGCIKQQFTNKFKTWFNEVYRKENRYRKHRLERGTLWDGPCKPERIEDDAQFGSCSLYIENNRLVVLCKEAIGALEEPPAFQGEFARDEAGDLRLGDARGVASMQPCYEELLESLKGYEFQSARYYLGACDAWETYLTNGKDAVWATTAEVDEYFTLAADKLPDGWRKVWFKDCPGILKPTPKYARTFAENPFYERLGHSPEVRAAHYGRLLLASCFHKREAIAELEDEEQFTEAGI